MAKSEHNFTEVILDNNGVVPPEFIDCLFISWR